MAHYQEWIAANFTPILEYKCDDAVSATAIADTGSAGIDLDEYGSPTYRAVTSYNYEADGYGVDVVTTNTGWYKYDYAGGGSNPFAGQDSGTFIFILHEPPTSNGIFFEIVGGGYNSRTSNTSFCFRNDGGEFAIECYSAGTEVFDMTVHTGDSLLSRPTLNSQMIVIVKDSANAMPKIWINGSYKNYEAIWDNTNAANFDPTWWVGDVAAVGDEIIAIGGTPTSVDSGSTVNSWNEDGTNMVMEYMAYLDEAMTYDQVHSLYERYWGGGTISEATTRTGRNPQRRYWQDQIDGGSLPSGAEQIDDMMVFSGSSINYWHYNYKYLGDNTFIDRANWNDWGEFIDSGVASAMQTSSGFYLNISPDNNWIGFNDNSNGSSASSSVNAVWHPYGYWMDARYLHHDMTDGVGQMSGLCNEAGDFRPLWDNGNNATGSYYWDEVRRQWVYQDAATTWASGGNTRGIISFSVQHQSWGKTNNPNRYAIGTNFVASTTDGQIIATYNPSTKQLTEDTKAAGSPIYGGYAAFVSDERDHVFFSYSSTTATPATGASSSQIFCWKLNGSSEWELDATLWNNGSAHSDQTSTSSTITSFLEIGDDLYCGMIRASGSYKNILHLRWNGSYYEEQSSVSILGDGSYYRSVNRISATPDGTFVVVCCSNAGSASNHPSMLAYSRDPSTGALTALDTLGSPNEFVFYNTNSPTNTGWVIDDADNNYRGQTTSEAWIRPRATMPTSPIVSPFECLLAEWYVSGANVIWSFAQASGSLLSSGYQADAEYTSWDLAVEGSGHTFEAEGGDTSQPDTTKRKAITFNGSGGFLGASGVGTVLDGDPSGAIVVCAKFTSSASSKVLVFSNSSNDGTDEIHIQVNASNQMEMEVFGAAGSLGTVNDGGGYNDGEWHCWAFSQASGTIYCWVDGVQQNTTSMGSAYWFQQMVPGTNCDHIGIAGEPNAAGTALANRFTGSLEFIGIGNVQYTSVIPHARHVPFIYKYS